MLTQLLKKRQGQTVKNHSYASQNDLIHLSDFHTVEFKLMADRRDEKQIGGSDSYDEL